MPLTITVRNLAALSGILLCGCVPHEPLPYSPNYSRIQLTDSPAGARAGAVRKGYDAPAVRHSRSVVVPDACITPDVAEQPVYLPPGCANNINLQTMVERQDDLFRGRKPGPAPAAPAAHAAQRYIYGATEGEMRTGRNENRSRSETTTPTSPWQPQSTTRTDTQR